MAEIAKPSTPTRKRITDGEKLAAISTLVAVLVASILTIVTTWMSQLESNLRDRYSMDAALTVEISNDKQRCEDMVHWVDNARKSGAGSPYFERLDTARLDSSLSDPIFVSVLTQTELADIANLGYLIRNHNFYTEQLNSVQDRMLGMSSLALRKAQERNLVQIDVSMTKRCNLIEHAADVLSGDLGIDIADYYRRQRYLAIIEFIASFVFLFVAISFGRWIRDTVKT